MTPDQEIAELSTEWPQFHFWRGRDRDGRPSGWHATPKRGTRAGIVAASGPEELRQRLRDLSAPRTLVAS